MMIPTKESIWNPLFISVFIANALLNVSQQMVQPLLTAYVKAIGAGVYGYVIMWRMALIPIAVAIVITIVCRKQFAN